MNNLFEKQRKELWNKWDFLTRETNPPILMRFPHDPKKVEDYLTSCQQEWVKKIVEMCEEMKKAELITETKWQQSFFERVDKYIVDNYSKKSETIDDYTRTLIVGNIRGFAGQK